MVSVVFGFLFFSGYNGEMAETITSKKSQKSEIKRWWAPAFAGAAAVIFVASGWMWWHYVRSNPERTFFAAIENSLRTQGVTRQVEQASSGQKLDQRVQLSVGRQHVAHGQTVIEQQGEVNATIKTEAISTPKEDYVRYTTIETTQKSQDGKDLDFSKLINLWGKAVPDPQGQSQAGELYNESVLGVVPVGNLRARDRADIMKFVHENKVYKVDAKSVKRKLEKGRPVYSYDVTVMPEAYIGMLKKYGKAAGLKQLEAVDPASYKDTEPLTFQLSVDVWSRQLTSIVFGGGERTEHMTGYGVARTVDFPKETIPLSELQSRLQAVQ